MSSRRARWIPLLTGVDPGLSRLKLAASAMVAVALAVVVAVLVRQLLAPAAPATMAIFAGVLALLSTLIVRDPDLTQRRVTTILLIGPALAAIVAGTLLAPHRIAADAVFVLVMVAAVWARRFGPRADACGMAAFLSFFLTQFLGARPQQLGWLALAAVIGILAGLVSRSWLFVTSPKKNLRRLVRSFRARATVLVFAVDDLLASTAPVPPAAHRRGRRQRDTDRRMARLGLARRRLNDAALLVQSGLAQDPGADDSGEIQAWFWDVELSLETLAMVAMEVAEPPEPTTEADVAGIRAVRTALPYVLDALHEELDPTRTSPAVDQARHAVARVGSAAGHRDPRVVALGFAVTGVCDTLTQDPGGDPIEPAESPGRDRTGPDEDDAASTDDLPAPEAAPAPAPGLSLSTRQAVQVGIATTLALVVAELIAPERWYWAVISAFVAFTGTQTRGDLLTRGWQRVLGTGGGMLIGLAVGALVSGNRSVSVALLLVCCFLALYLVQLSAALMAFWVTTALALLFSLTGSPGVIVLRLEETLIGCVAAALVAFFVIPRNTRGAFGDSVDALVAAMSDVLDDAVDRIAGRAPRRSGRDLVTAMTDALNQAEQRGEPLTRPLAKGRAGHRQALGVLSSCTYFLRSIARLADRTRDPGGEPQLRTAAEQVTADLRALADVLLRTPSGSGDPEAAGRRFDAAEQHVLSHPEPDQRALGVVAMLRRMHATLADLIAESGGRAHPSSPPPNAKAQPVDTSRR